jgi:hypothetical protein
MGTDDGRVPLAGEPALFYAFGLYALPYYLAFHSDDVNGRRVSTSETGLRYSGWGPESIAGGVGIGHTGPNARLDLRNATLNTDGTAGNGPS